MLVQNFTPGTSIDGEVATQFAAVTGATISLHDLSINSLSADYDPYMDIRELCNKYHAYIYLCL